MVKKTLQLLQLETKMQMYPRTMAGVSPPTGWLKAIRVALGMSLEQVASKSSITRQSIREIELREMEGTITLKTLRQTAKAMDMEVVYGLVPVDGSLEALIDRKARELASMIVSRTTHTMKLEDQENSKERIANAIEERTALLKYEMPKTLWD